MNIRKHLENDKMITTRKKVKRIVRKSVQQQIVRKLEALSKNQMLGFALNVVFDNGNHDVTT